MAAITEQNIHHQQILADTPEYDPQTDCCICLTNKRNEVDFLPTCSKIHDVCAECFNKIKNKPCPQCRELARKIPRYVAALVPAPAIQPFANQGNQRSTWETFCNSMHSFFNDSEWQFLRWTIGILLVGAIAGIAGYLLNSYGILSANVNAQ